MTNKINKRILNLDIEEMNRNTRYFKSYLKDQIKEQNKKSLKDLPDLKKDQSGLFKKQDSLTKNIQMESAAPLRRLTNRGISLNGDKNK